MTYEQEIAWAGGLFEGEGCFSASPRKYSGQGMTRVQPCADLSMVDEDVVRRFANIVGFGLVRAKTGQNGYQPQWAWRTHGVADFERIVVLLWPFLGKRRRERAAEIMLMLFENRQLGVQKLRCEWCGEIFAVPYVRHSQKYCSRKCGNAGYATRRAVPLVAGQPSTGS